jgi:FkbM family methyltransferase
VSDIFIFEPDRTNCRLLMRTLRANRLEHVFLVPFAASASAGVTTFYPDRASGASGSLENHCQNAHSLHAAYGMGESLAVPTLPLDLFADFCHGKRVLIKIDVEGHELEVLRGAETTLEVNKFPPIIFEAWTWKPWYQEKRQEVFKHLTDLGYKIRELGENNLAQHPAYESTHLPK